MLYRVELGYKEKYKEIEREWWREEIPMAL